MFFIILGVALFNLALGYGLALYLHGRNGPFAWNSGWEFPFLADLWTSWFPLGSNAHGSETIIKSEFSKNELESQRASIGSR